MIPLTRRTKKATKIVSVALKYSVLTQGTKAWKSRKSFRLRVGGGNYLFSSPNERMKQMLVRKRMFSLHFNYWTQIAVFVHVKALEFSASCQHLPRREQICDIRLNYCSLFWHFSLRLRKVIFSLPEEMSFCLFRWPKSEVVEGLNKSERRNYNVCECVNG